MDTVSIDTERELRAPVETVRRTVQTALERMTFTVDRCESGLIEAHRGSTLKAGFGTDRRAVRASVSVMGHGGTARVHVHLGDAEPLSANPHALVPAYQPLLYATLSELDGWLLAVDPAMPVPAPPALEVSRGGPSYLRTRLAGAARHLPGTVGRSTAQALHPELPLWIVAPDATATLTPDEAQMLLTVASIATAYGDGLPPAHARRVEDLTVKLRQTIENARPPGARLDVSEVDRQALDFLHRQMLIRQGLPVRELRQCQDCGFEKIVNPDYRKHVMHNQALQQLTGLVGVSIGSSGANVFALAGRLFNLNELRSKTIPCARCEGTAADVRLVTICPQCREIRKEPLLLVCPNKACRYDFRDRAGDTTWWRPMDAPPIEEPVDGGDVPAGWYDDPSGRHQLRYFDEDWTDWAADEGVTVEDPLDDPLETADAAKGN